MTFAGKIALTRQEKNRFGLSEGVSAATVAPGVPLGGGFGRDLANWLFPVFLGIILLGFLCIWKFGSAPGTANPVRALFIAMNAATLSGFSGTADLNDAGQCITLLLIICGSLFAMIVGGLAVIRIAKLRFSDAQLIAAAVIVELLVLLVGTSLLWVNDLTPFEAAFLAGSSFGNCGLCLGDPPPATDMMVHAVILPLTIIGGLGIPVVMEIWCSVLFRREVSVHSKVTIAASAWLYAIGLVLILALNQAGHGWPSVADLKNAAPGSSVLAVESRTGGMAITPVGDLTPCARWFVVVLMAIGAGSAGTASGLKVTTFVELFGGTRKILRGENPGRPFGIAVAWVGIYVGLVVLAVLLLAYVSSTDPADSVLFNAVSAMSNVGFTVSPVPDQKSLSFAYCAIVLVGRMAPLMVLWWMAETTSEGEMGIG